MLLKRLQEQNSVYNAYEWEYERRRQRQLVKNICYHPPSLLRNESRKKRRKGIREILSAKNEPNRQLYELYQSSLRGPEGEHMGDEPHSSVDPLAGNESARTAEDDK